MDTLTVAIFSFPFHADLLPYVLQSVQKHAPPYKEICLVWDDFIHDPHHSDFGLLQQQTGCTFRLIKHSEVCQWPESIKGWGWLRQQLVKMKCYLWTDTKYTWVVDGDVCIIAEPELFDQTGRPYLRYHKQVTHQAYVDFIKKYLDINEFYPYDFVGSTCLLRNSICKEIDDRIKQHTGLDLIDCVDQCIRDSTCDPLPFSEFETYGTYVYNYYREHYTLAMRNWNYGPNESAWSMPIQIMWNEIPEIENLDYPSKIQWLTNKHHSAKIIT